MVSTHILSHPELENLTVADYVVKRGDNFYCLESKGSLRRRRKRQIQQAFPEKVSVFFKHVSAGYNGHTAVCTD